MRVLGFSIVWVLTEISYATNLQLTMEVIPNNLSLSQRTHSNDILHFTPRLRILTNLFSWYFA